MMVQVSTVRGRTRAYGGRQCRERGGLGLMVDDSTLREEELVLWWKSVQ